MDPTYLPLAEQIKLAKSSSASSRELAMLITVPHAIVRHQVARNARTSNETLSILVNDPFEIVKRSLAENPRLPDCILNSLAKDVEFSVRCKVAQHNSCPLKQLHELAKDNVALVRDAAIRNPRTSPRTILSVIFQEENNALRSFALKLIHTYPPEKWKDAVIEGLELSDLVEYRGEHVALGDALIGMGENDTYQSIQAAVLASRVDTKTREHEDELPTPRVKDRKLSL